MLSGARQRTTRGDGRSTDVPLYFRSQPYVSAGNRPLVNLGLRGELIMELGEDHVIAVQRSSSESRGWASAGQAYGRGTEGDRRG